MSLRRVGLVGAGHIAATHARAWRRAQGFALAGVHDRERERAEQSARRFRLPAVFETFEELVEQVDVVDVCTPPDTHFPLARAAIVAGRDLLLEKPAVTELAHWQELSRLLEDSGSRLAVVHNLKFSRAVQRARRWIESGRIGKVLRLNREFLTHPSSDRMLNGGHWSHRLPGGRWLETLPHELYLLHHLAGPMDLRAVVAASAAGSGTGAAADEVLITLERNGCLATIHYSASCRLNRRRLTVHGSEGWIEIELLSDSARLSRWRDARWRRAVGPQLQDGAATLGSWLPDRAGYLWQRLRGSTPHARLIRAFGDHLRGAATPPTPLAEIDYVIRNTDLIGRRIEEQLAPHAPG